LKVIFLIK